MVAVAAALQLVAGLVLVGTAVDDANPTSGTDPDPAARTVAARHPASSPTVPDAPPDPVEPAAPPAPVADAGEEDRSLVVPEPGSPAMTAAGSHPPTVVAASAPQSEQIFAREHPAHAAARQRDDVASSFHWAVIVGVNDYMGRTSSTIGSVSDALVLRDTLYRHGWRGDQVLTLTDHAATHDQIVRALEWLIRSTDERSTVIVSFSGHMDHEGGKTAVWPADNRRIWADDLSRMLGAVRADRMWVSLQGCHAAGLAAPGMEVANRLVTYSSRVEEKAYEDPATRHSVMGYYLFAEGLRDGRGDTGAGNGDGRVTVQEAFAWAAPRATSRTSGQQPYGAQRPVAVDHLGGRAFPIAVTGAPPPAAAGPPAGGQRDEGAKTDSGGGLLDSILDLPGRRLNRPLTLRG